MCLAPPTRVLVVYGTETGTAKRAVTALAKDLEARSANAKIVDIKDGNSVGPLEELKDNYDMIIVSTSSFGEGDPPGNYGGFLGKLLKSSTAGDKPLAGMQHAVLGFGSSVYETFQNCPRLTDKYLGECGSRRCAQRQCPRMWMRACDATYARERGGRRVSCLRPEREREGGVTALRDWDFGSGVVAC